MLNDQQSDGLVGLYGRVNNQRTVKWIKSDYINDHPNLNKYKVVLAKSNGSGAFGETLTSPSVVEPQIGHTQTFISLGAYNTEAEANNLLSYIKTKFLRALLGILKVTQDNKKAVWAYIPLQDFSSSSDINWAMPISEIDKQLYKKYGLSKPEIEFIESMIRPME